MTTRLAIFDCDGTLVDGQAAVCEAMEQAFAAVQLAPPHRSEVRRIVGLSLPVAVRQLAPSAEHEQVQAVVDGYKQAFFAARQEGRVHEPLFDGMRDMLVELGAAGWSLAVATGKSDRGLTTVLATHQLTDMFASLQTADRHPSKPHPSMIEQCLADTLADRRDAVMIGDTVYDVEMALNAGVRAVGVAWGYHGAEELLAAGAVGVARDCTELKELMR